MRLDFIDYPTGWELQDQVGIDSPPHHKHCSAVTQRGSLLWTATPSSSNGSNWAETPTGTN